MTMPLTCAEVQTLLSQYNSVTVQQDANGTSLTVDSPLTVAAGKTLTLDNVNLAVDPGGSLQVNGAMSAAVISNSETMQVDGTLSAAEVNNTGTVTVTTNETLRLSGNFSGGELIVTSTGKVVSEGSVSPNTLTLSEGAQVLAKEGFGAAKFPAGWIASTETDASGYYTLYRAYTITFDANGGTLADPDNPALETNASGCLDSLLTAARSPNSGSTASYTLAGWFTSPTGGTQISRSTVFTQDATVYAHWNIWDWDWEYTDDAQTSLRIFGNGKMPSLENNQPWSSTVTSVTVEGGVTNIGAYAFRGCTALTSVTLEEGVTEIGTYAFSGCTALTSVAMGEGVTGIGANAFSGCSSLDGVRLPSTLTSIGNSAFSECASLSGITIPSGVTLIDEWTFNQTGLTSVTIPGTVTKIAEAAFRQCGKLERADLLEGVEYLDYHSFWDCTKLKQITVPKSVTYIQVNAFAGVTADLSYAGTRAEWNAGGENMRVPSTVTVHCTDDPVLEGTKLTISNMEAYMAAKDGGVDYSAVTEAVLTGEVSAISAGAFMDMSNLAAVTIPSSVTTIGTGAFSGCTALTAVTIPSSVTEIGSSAFARSGLTSVTVPAGVTSFGDNVFEGCESLASATLSFQLPESDAAAGLYELPASTFSGCKALTDLTGITFPSNMTMLGLSAFEYCAGLTEVVIPDGVTFINAYAFGACTSLTKVTLPASVEEINSGAFQSCDGLTDVVFLGTQQEWADRGLASLFASATVTFPNDP